MGLPMPSLFMVACFPAPNIPEGEKTWTANRLLAGEEFINECRQWDLNEAVGSGVVGSGLQTLHVVPKRARAECIYAVLFVCLYVHVCV